MKAKAQGSMEYLLLVGGVIVIVAIVVALIVNAVNSAIPPECEVACESTTIGELDKEAACTGYIIASDPEVNCPGTCVWSGTQCYYQP